LTLRVIRVACQAQGKDSAIRKTKVALSLIKTALTSSRLRPNQLGERIQRAVRISVEIHRPENFHRLSPKLILHYSLTL
jgi:hypothetical protein